MVHKKKLFSFMTWAITCFAQENIEVYLEGRIPKIDGRRPTFTAVLKLISERKVQTIVETGTARCGDTNFDGDGGSTIIFGHWAYNHNANMFSVDINPTHIDIARKVTIPYLRNLSYVLDDSAHFLRNFKGKIDFLYLDSWDYSEKDPKPAQQHCLREIEAAYDKLTSNSIVMIDDCNVPGGGKGLLAIQYLKDRGWHVFINRHQVILLKNKQP